MRDGCGTGRAPRLCRNSPSKARRNRKNANSPSAVPRVELLQAIEILDVTEKAEEIIKAVPVWKA